MKSTILMIEDDYSIADAVSFLLKKEGFNILWAANGKSGIELFKSNDIDLIILDVMLPDISGFDILKQIDNKNVPVIMLTARVDIVDKVLGLELGADDYITKPFDNRELIARIKAALRRISSIKEDNNDDIKVGENVVIHKKSHKVERDGIEIKFKPKEYNLLLFLAENKDVVFKREVLLDRIWGIDFEGDDRTVDVHIRRIRNKIDDHSGIIETVFGIGYRMNK
ncbi:response regulator transcription factor [Inconstantimicrobium porci]|uniref:response regulator transcription factor n=1 Tax=Inconstantimicrobium porci TaxID=2652291 RepID=UPI00240A36A4|nr:response regulator transcription factor [Inconstantimicrobium porci]MDD6770190.1 response regulator transcription factor [Inconstantimicrobium porci]